MDELLVGRVAVGGREVLDMVKLRICLKQKLRLIMSYAKNDKGSFIIEGAIIIPLFVFILLALMTLLMIMHDHFVSDVVLHQTIERSRFDGASVNQRGVGIERKVYDNIEGKMMMKQMDVSLNGNQVRMDRTYDLLLLDKLQTTTMDYDIYIEDSLDNVKKIELIGDVLEYMSFSDVIHHRYNLSLESFMELLESD